MRYPDAAYKDTWGNQKVGEIGKDSNRDGYVDHLWRDTTGNGVLDTLLVDTNHDHKSWMIARRKAGLETIEQMANLLSREENVRTISLKTIV